jgi:flagellar protein FlbD
MIVLHKLNGDEFLLNSNHIETVEQRPDTVITLTNEKKYIVTESAEEIIGKVIEYKRKLYKSIE